MPPPSPAELPRGLSGRLRAEVFEGMTRAQVIGAMERLDEGVEHPFAEPTTYQVHHEGKCYPPKAVFGLAASEHLGLQLGPSDFSAGEGQPCFRVLRDLGLEILPLQGEASTEGRKTWALLCNPEVFDAEGAAAVLDEGLWALPKGDPEPGDRLLIWKAKGGGLRRGVVALGKVLEGPRLQEPDEQSNRFFQGTAPAEESRRFRLRYIPLPAGPLWLGEDAGDVLAKLPVARGQGNKLYAVSKEQWGRVMALIGGWPGDQAGLAIAVAPGMGDGEERQDAGSGGQGFGASSEYRKAVELRAMAMAEEHFSQAGYDLENTSANKPYDFVARRQGATLYIEVKGTANDGSQVFLTKNEVSHARGHPGQCALFVVSGILVAEGADGRLEATGGVARVKEPWIPAEGDLTALTYRYVVPRETGDR